jgi:hypothetical protein
MKVVYSILQDGSHVHYREGMGIVCKKNHRKPDMYKFWITVAGLVELAIIFQLINKAW